MSRNTRRKMVVIVSGWEVISDETGVYFNCKCFPNFLQTCFAFMLREKNNKSYKTRKEQQKNTKGRLTSISKTKIQI